VCGIPIFLPSIVCGCAYACAGRLFLGILATRPTPLVSHTRQVATHLHAVHRRRATGLHLFSVGIGVGVFAFHHVGFKSRFRIHGVPQVMSTVTLPTSDPSALGGRTGKNSARDCGYDVSGRGFRSACGSLTGYIPSWSCGWSSSQHSRHTRRLTFFVLIVKVFRSGKSYRKPHLSQNPNACLPTANGLPTYITIRLGTNRTGARSRSSALANSQASLYWPFSISSLSAPSGIFVAII